MFSTTSSTTGASSTTGSATSSTTSSVATTSCASSSLPLFLRSSSLSSRPSLALLPISFALLNALMIRNSTIAVQKKVMIALITAPQSRIRASVTTAPLASSTASLSTVCRPFSLIGIQLIRGFRILLTSELTIAVKAEPIIIPTAKSITLPLLINALNSLRSFLICLVLHLFYFF